MSETNQIWNRLDAVFEKEEFSNWKKFIDELFKEKINFEEFARSCKTLADLYTSNSNDEIRRKGYGYCLLTAKTYIAMKRMAPSLALLDQLKKAWAPEQLVQYLEQEISTSFSRSSKPEKKQMSANSKLESAPQEPKPQDEESKEKDFPVQTHFEEFPLFSKLSYNEVYDLIQRSKIIELQSNELLFSEGDEGAAFYIVAEGEIELTSQSRIKKTFKEGDYFGELSLLGNMKRTGTITSLSKAKLIEFSKERLVQSFVVFPQIEENVLQSFYLRLFLSQTSKLSVFKGYSESELKDFFYSFSPCRAKAHSILFKEGDPSEEFFFLINGEIEIKHAAQDPILLGPSSFVGEIGFLDKRARMATATTKTECHYLACPRYMFENFARNFPKILNLMKQVANFRKKQQAFSL